MPIRVTVELIPYGDESKAEVLDKLYIENTGHGDKEIGIYRYALMHRDHPDTIPKEFLELTGTLTGFSRGRGRLALVTEVLNKIEKGAQE